MRYVLMTIALLGMLACAGTSIALSLGTVALAAVGSYGTSVVALLLAVGFAAGLIPTSALLAHARRIR